MLDAVSRSTNATVPIRLAASPTANSAGNPVPVEVQFSAPTAANVVDLRDPGPTPDVPDMALLAPSDTHLKLTFDWGGRDTSLCITAGSEGPGTTADRGNRKARWSAVA